MASFRYRFVVPVLTLWAFFAVGSGTALAHHSLAAFDRDKQIVIDGVVKTFTFANPHSLLVVVERLPVGGTKDWTLETDGPSVLFRYNVNSQTFAPGDHITVVAHPHRTDPGSGAVMRVVKADGTTFVLQADKRGP